jgi:pyruvate/2-oxoglutarate/acetoin dehydrogenase E1 component
MNTQDIEIVKDALTANSIDARTAAQIIAEIEEQLRLIKLEQKADAGEKIVKKFAFVAIDCDCVLFRKELTGYAVQIPEDESEFSIEGKIAAAAHEYNRTKKGMRSPVKTIAEACEFVPARFFRDQNIWIKHKEAAFLLSSNNELDRAQVTIEFPKEK